jgi:hypothetical protein
MTAKTAPLDTQPQKLANNEPEMGRANAEKP